MGFLSSIFTGDNPTLNKLQDTFGSIGGTANKLGGNDVATASDFFNSILSGGGSKYLAPQVNSITNQGNQKIQSLSQFGNRGGGTNAAVQAVGDTTRANINDLYAGQATGAADALANIGQGQQSLGLSAFSNQAQLAQMIQQMKANSILGKGISAGVGALESFGLGAGFNALDSDVFKTMNGVKTGTGVKS